jgi:hypothetical protein
MQGVLCPWAAGIHHRLAQLRRRLIRSRPCAGGVPSFLRRWHGKAYRIAAVSYAAATVTPFEMPANSHEFANIFRYLLK